ncbi:MAG TPA: preprotein translocase subunit SecE [Candidatus Limnocylindrales bacterium]|nr:preprotein translocase subunit SecE [Candidatus Limnocylindrales bacterium]
MSGEATGSRVAKGGDAAGTNKAATTSKGGVPAASGPGKFQQARDFVNEAIAELKRVYWPSRKETMAFTWVVLVVVAFVSLYLGMIDYLISLAMRLVF